MCLCEFEIVIWVWICWSICGGSWRGSSGLPISTDGAPSVNTIQTEVRTRIHNISLLSIFIARDTSSFGPLDFVLCMWWIALFEMLRNEIFIKLLSSYSRWLEPRLGFSLPAPIRCLASSAACVVHRWYIHIAHPCVERKSVAQLLCKWAPFCARGPRFHSTPIHPIIQHHPPYHYQGYISVCGIWNLCGVLSQSRQAAQRCLIVLFRSVIRYIALVSPTHPNW